MAKKIVDMTGFETFKAARADGQTPLVRLKPGARVMVKYLNCEKYKKGKKEYVFPRFMVGGTEIKISSGVKGFEELPENQYYILECSTVLEKYLGNPFYRVAIYYVDATKTEEECRQISELGERVFDAIFEVREREKNEKKPEKVSV